MDKIELKKSSINLRKADKEATPLTFDLNNVKSTVTNPSQTFKWISVEDEQKIVKYVSDNYSNASTFEKQQAVQWLYNAAFNKQKQADIDAWRQQVKLDLINKANNANIGKQKNEYLTQLKRADLADLIRDQLVKQWYKRSDFMNVTDEWIIKWFLDTNPQYKDVFNRFYYDNENWAWQVKYNQNDIIKLGKDLGWIEKTGGDVFKDKVSGIAQWMAWWMPYWGEWAKDILDTWVKWADFDRYVEDKYGTYAWALTEKDLKQAKADFENVDKQQYTPNYVWGAAKMAMWLTDIVFTAWGLKWAGLLKNNLFKLWFSTLANDDYMSRAPEALWTGLEFIGENINKIPWFSDIRDSLQTEQEKADWDAFVGWNVLALFRSGKRTVNDLKDVDIKTIKQAFDDAKKWNVEGGIQNIVKENAIENRTKKYNESKLEKSQEITQWEIETRKSASQWLDTLHEEWQLKNVKTVDDLAKNTQDTIDKLKKQQTEIASKENKKYWNSELWLPDEVDVLDSNWNKTKQKVVTYPVAKLLDNIIEHYEKTDPKEAAKYKSYKRALEKWSLPADVLLEIKREWNSLNQKVYNNKTNLLKDTDKAEAWAKNMSEVNQVFEWLDMGENIRNIDSKLSGLYTVKQGIENIKKAEANFNKKAIKWSSLARWFGKTVSRILSKLSFGTTNFLSKAFVSMIQESIGGGSFEKLQYNPAEIAEKIPQFVKEYEALLKKIETWNDVPKHRITRRVNAFIDKRELWAMYKSPEDEED